MKSTLRKNILKIRADIPEDVRLEKNQAVYQYALQVVETYQPKIIALFVDYRHEVETRKLIRTLLEKKLTVALPVTDFDTMSLTFVAIKGFSDLWQTEKKLWEPMTGVGPIIDPKSMDLIFSPGAAFDKRGYRMGYGGGFYDRLLAQKPPHCKSVGLAFDEQWLEEIPTEPHDARLDGLITDSGIHWF